MKPELEELEQRNLLSSGPVDPPTPPIQLTNTTYLVGGHAIFLADPTGNRAEIDVEVVDPQPWVALRLTHVADVDFGEWNGSAAIGGPGLRSMGLTLNSAGLVSIFYQVGDVVHRLTMQSEDGSLSGEMLDDLATRYNTPSPPLATIAPPASVPQVTPPSVVQLVAAPNLATLVIATAMQGRPDVFSQGTSLAFADPSVVEWLSARK